MSDSVARKNRIIGDLVAKLRNVWIFAAGLVLLIISVVFNEALRGGWELSIFFRPQTYAALSQELGFALIIAFLIAMAIERAAKREFSETVNARMEDIQKQVFRSTYGRNVPATLIDEVELLVLQANFMRHHHRLTYDLSMVHASQLDPTKRDVPNISIIRAEVTMSYEVENISSMPQSYTVAIDVEKPPFATLHQFVEIHGVGIDNEELTREQIAAYVTEDNDLKHFRKPVPTVFPGQKIRIKGTWQAIKFIDDSELWRSYLPCDGMTLCVHFPDEATVRGAMALHRSQLVVRSKGRGRYCEWAIPDAVLPHQGIVFWWRCSDPPTVASSVAAGEREGNTARPEAGSKEGVATTAHG